MGRLSKPKWNNHTRRPVAQGNRVKECVTTA
jgi:hypothetical protein